MSKGFTLIELLVVIAIIGVLAATIISELSDARQLGIQSKITTEMDAIRKTASFIESEELTYDSICGSNSFATSTKILDLITSIERFASSSVICNSATDQYAISIDLPFSEHWCVDSRGVARQIASQLTAGTDFACPEP